MHRLWRDRSAFFQSYFSLSYPKWHLLLCCCWHFRPAPSFDLLWVSLFFSTKYMRIGTSTSVACLEGSGNWTFIVTWRLNSEIPSWTQHSDSQWGFEQILKASGVQNPGAGGCATFPKVTWASQPHVCSFSERIFSHIPTSGWRGTLYAGKKKYTWTLLGHLMVEPWSHVDFP